MSKNRYTLIALFGVLIVFTFYKLIIWTGKSAKENIMPDHRRETPDKIFVADILPFSAKIEPAVINSAGDYILISHLVRTLVRLNKNLQIEGDLALKWQIDPQYKWYKFFLDPKAQFSNGDPIRPVDVQKTLQRCAQHGRAVHFDFSKIDTVTTGSDYVLISFKEPEYSFLHHANKPEFGVLHESDYLSKVGEVAFRVTSGPYRVNSPVASKGKGLSVELTNNAFFPSFGAAAPKEVELKFSTDEEKLLAVSKKSIDFLIPYEAFDKKLKQTPNGREYNRLQPHIGFTYWLSVNPETVTKVQDRNFIQSVLSGPDIELSAPAETWVKANQLYLPEGPSRLSREAVTSIWRDLVQNARASKYNQDVRLLLERKFPFNDMIVDRLKSVGLKAKVTFYDSQAQFADYVVQKKNNFDIILTNNDFSSHDLMENMRVAFNASRPLIFINSGFKEITNNFEAAQRSNGEVRELHLEKIGKELLSQGLIIPLVYRQIFFYYGKHVELNNWSTLFPEVSFWKAEIKH